MKRIEPATAPEAAEIPPETESKGESPMKFAVVVFLIPLLFAIAAGFWAR